MRNKFWFFAVLTSCVSACLAEKRSASALSNQRHPELSLDIVHSIELPEQFKFGGSIFGRGDTIYVWDRNATVFRSVNYGPLVAISKIASDSIVGMSEDDGQFFVVDAKSRKLKSLSDDSGFECAIPTQIVHNGVRGDDGKWYVAAADSLNDQVVAVGEISAGHKGSCPSWTVVAVDTGGYGSVSRRAGHGVWFNFRDPRRSSVAISKGGAVVPSVPLNPEELATVKLADDDKGHWASLIRVDLGRQSMQVLADTRSQKRRLVLRDEDNSVVRVRELEGTWGVVDSDARRSALLAIHETSGSRLLVYHWRWLE